AHAHRACDVLRRYSSQDRRWPWRQADNNRPFVSYRLPPPLSLERVVHQNCVFPLGTGRQQCDRTIAQFLDSTHILYRLRGQFGPRPCAGGRTFPSLDRLVNRVNPRLRGGACRKIVDFTPVESIADADFYLVEPIEDIELGQRQAIDAAGARGLPHQHGIEPAAAARAARHRAELAAALAEQPPCLVLLLGREWPLAHPRRV